MTFFRSQRWFLSYATLVSLIICFHHALPFLTLTFTSTTSPVYTLSLVVSLPYVYTNKFVLLHICICVCSLEAFARAQKERARKFAWESHPAILLELMPWLVRRNQWHEKRFAVVPSNDDALFRSCITRLCTRCVPRNESSSCLSFSSLSNHTHTLPYIWRRTQYSTH